MAKPNQTVVTFYNPNAARLYDKRSASEKVTSKDLRDTGFMVSRFYAALKDEDLSTERKNDIKTFMRGVVDKIEQSHAELDEIEKQVNSFPAVEKIEQDPINFKMNFYNKMFIGIVDVLKRADEINTHIQSLKQQELLSNKKSKNMQYHAVGRVRSIIEYIAINAKNLNL